MEQANPLVENEAADGGEARGSALVAVYLIGIGLLWLVNGLGGLVGLHQPLGPVGPVSFSSGAGPSAIVAVAYTVVVFVLIVPAWRGRWWGLVLLGGFHLTMAGIAFGAQLMAAAVAFLVIGMVGFFLLGLSKA